MKPFEIGLFIGIGAGAFVGIIAAIIAGVKVNNNHKKSLMSKDKFYNGQIIVLKHVIWAFQLALAHNSLYDSARTRLFTIRLSKPIASKLQYTESYVQSIIQSLLDDRCYEDRINQIYNEVELSKDKPMSKFLEELDKEED